MSLNKTTFFFSRNPSKSTSRARAHTDTRSCAPPAPALPLTQSPHLLTGEKPLPAALNSMPRDPSGQQHTGTYGLFDDVDETARSSARAEAKEMQALQSQVRRQQRRDRHQEYKETKMARRVAAGKTPESRMSGLLGRVFGGRRKGDLGSMDAEEAVRKIEVIGGEQGGAWEKERAGGRGRVSYNIVRRPKTPDPVYQDKDVQAVDSLWLRECGMVKVKSKNPGGCHIVSKTIIQKEDGLDGRRSLAWSPKRS